MKCSEAWLREWVNPNLNLVDLCDKLTMSGLEVEEIIPVGSHFKGVVIGEVIAVAKHPEANRLHLCEVSVGQKDLLKIVCGAENVRVGLKVAVAMIGAELPNNITIKPAKIRGYDSEGMLCSAKELSLAEEAPGLLELPIDAPIGADLKQFLGLNDFVIDLSITPNRGDCLSVRGIAREVSTLMLAPIHAPHISTTQATITDQIPVKVTARDACPHYVGRVIKNIRADAETPIWMQERLRRSGIRRINPIVDVTNYVMLELGQPMHAFDLNKIDQEILVRFAKDGEKLMLLDGSEVNLTSQTLIIADHHKPLAIAGVMGGLSSGVTSLTTNIFLESAYFEPANVAKTRQYYNLSSDSAYRFERGIDHAIQREAIERATALILKIAGGESGPVIEQKNENKFVSHFIKLTKDKMEKTLGLNISKATIESIWNALHFDWEEMEDGWQIKVPSYRPDLFLPEDLIEEVARIYGYDKIPTHQIKAALQVYPLDQRYHFISNLRQHLKAKDYHEIVSYSFIEPKLQKLLGDANLSLALLNPISSEMAEMRTSLWPGLVNTYLYNKSRQQYRMRLFEIGLCFKKYAGELTQTMSIAGLVSGSALAEQWGIATRELDFYDVKSHLDNMLKEILKVGHLLWRKSEHAALHPGQSAEIVVNDQKIGVMGLVHPNILQALDVTQKFYLFELNLEAMPVPKSLHYQEWSKFPEIRRDLAILVNATIPSDKIQDTIKTVAGDWLKDIFIFDVYQGKGVAPGFKSVALALILQHPSRTLIDEEVTELTNRVVEALQSKLGAQLRS